MERPPARPPQENVHPLVGQPLPPFRLPDAFTGEERTSEEWQGKLYILNLFASW